MDGGRGRNLQHRHRNRMYLKLKTPLTMTIFSEATPQKLKNKEGRVFVAVPGMSSPSN